MPICALCDVEKADVFLMVPLFQTDEAELALKLRGGKKVCYDCCRTLCEHADQKTLLDLLFEVYDETCDLKADAKTLEEKNDELIEEKEKIEGDLKEVKTDLEDIKYKIDQLV